MDYIVDEARRDLVLDAILDRYRRGAYPYNKKKSMLAVLDMPESLERGGEHEARFWFFSCMLMRGGVNSDTALEAMCRLYDREMRPGGSYPFDPHKAAGLSVKKMTRLIANAGTGLRRFARDWLNCSRILIERYDGQVMHLLQDFNQDFETAVVALRNRKKTGFPGFQYKMVSMLLFFVTESGLIEYFPYPPPIDFHLQRVPTETEFISRVDGSKIMTNGSERERMAFEETLRKIYLDFIRKRGIKSNELSDAVWLHSRTLCKQAPGNLTRKPKTTKEGRSQPVMAPGVDFDTKVDLAKYNRSCARCSVEQYCRYNVSSGHFYVQGQMKIIAERKKPPSYMLTLPLIDTDSDDNQVDVFKRPPDRKSPKAPSKEKMGQTVLELSPAQT